MSLWKLTLAYDGTSCHGWQIQPGLTTIQGTLAEAIHRITGEQVLPQGSGRTDTGVHALGQVASFELATPIPSTNFHRALNRCLPSGIRVLTCDHAPPGFHARHSARRKTYEYRIFSLYPSPTPQQMPRICLPTLAPFVWPCPWHLSLDALNRAATHVIGTHDFTSFAASDPHAHNPTPTPVRTIHHSCWHAEADLLIYRVTGSGFLHHMVRNLVGTFVLAGSGRLSPDAIPALLGARNRSLTGPTAPASGLFLLNVEYPVTNAGSINSSTNQDSADTNDGDDDLE